MLSHIVPRVHHPNHPQHLPMLLPRVSMTSTSGRISSAVKPSGARSTVPRTTRNSCGTSHQRGNAPLPRWE